MQSPGRQLSRTLLVTVTLCSTACRSTGHRTTSRPDPEPESAATQPVSSANSELKESLETLVAAEPRDWVTSYRAAEQAALDVGVQPSLAELTTALRAFPDAPGSEAGFTLLGALLEFDAPPPDTPTTRGAVRLCLSRIETRSLEAHAAARALSGLRSPTVEQTLERAAKDPFATTGLRAAATATLIRHGSAHSVRTVAEGILLAGSPAGATIGHGLGFPDRSRWANERAMVLAAISATCGQDFGMVPDSPWPVLEVGTRNWLATLPASNTGSTAKPDPKQPGGHP